MYDLDPGMRLQLHRDGERRLARELERRRLAAEYLAERRAVSSRQHAARPVRRWA